MVAEILDGELVVHPRPAIPHAFSASRLGAHLGRYFDGDDGDDPGSWTILDEPELHLGAHVVVPDIAGWRYPRIPGDGASTDVAPDWVCEVLSPSTAHDDRTRKMRIYGEYGVPFAWLIDPIARTLEVFRREGRVWLPVQSARGSERICPEPFETQELRLDRLWGLR